MIDQIARSWLGLPERTRRIFALAALALVPAVFTSLLYAVLVIVLAASAAFVATGSWPWLLRVGVVGAGGPLVLVGLGLAFHGAGLPRPALPGSPIVIQVSQPPTATEAEELQAVAPGVPETWIASGLSASSFQDVAYHKALMVDPTNRQAAYNLAATYLEYGHESGGLLDEEIAAYYLTLAGYPAPPNAPPIGLSH